MTNTSGTYWAAVRSTIEAAPAMTAQQLERIAAILAASRLADVAASKNVPQAVSGPRYYGNPTRDRKRK